MNRADRAVANQKKAEAQIAALQAERGRSAKAPVPPPSGKSLAAAEARVMAAEAGAKAAAAKASKTERLLRNEIVDLEKELSRAKSKLAAQDKYYRWVVKEVIAMWEVGSDHTSIHQGAARRWVSGKLKPGDDLALIWL